MDRRKKSIMGLDNAQGGIAGMRALVGRDPEDISMNGVKIGRCVIVIDVPSKDRSDYENVAKYYTSRRWNAFFHCSCDMTPGHVDVLMNMFYACNTYLLESDRNRPIHPNLKLT